ncbi:MAG: hypothetical protein ACTSR3_05760 [Candidatus Helarchaeota archaeon]
MGLTNKIVKKKHLQNINKTCVGVIIPSPWIKGMDWNKTTNLVLEFLPYRKMIIISEEIKKIKNEEDIIQV